MTAKPKADPTHLKDLTPDPANARKHGPRNVGTIVSALNEVGAARSIVIDEDGVILAGNATAEAAAEAGITKVRVVDVDGETVVAVRRSNLTPQQKARLALFDNRAAELAEGWDEDVLRQMLADGVSFDGLWTPDELAELMEPAPAEKAKRTAPDDVPVERPTAIKRGDLYALGEHRLLCGDSANAHDVATLMGDVRAGLMNTDPPYGIAYSNPKANKQKVKIENDALDSEAFRQFLTDMLVVALKHALKPKVGVYVWHAAKTVGHFNHALEAAGIKLHRQIIWAKPRFVLGHGQFHWAHEPAIMGWPEGGQPPDYGAGGGERNQTTVWEVASVTNAERADFGHLTTKPVALFSLPILKHLKPGEACYEPFAGTGPQFIAAEDAKVRCFGIEISPSFCQVIIDRWEQYTGKKAEKLPPPEK